ncbi:MAG: hypothetical protein Q9159_003200 [Coniocarpon cinnabarinum]
MVFGLILGAASIPLAGGAIVTPTVTGVGKGVGSSQSDSAKTEEMGKNARLKIYCDILTPAGKSIHGRPIGLTDGCVIVQSAHAPPSSPFLGFYISYPSGKEGENTMGLVSMLGTVPPSMGWIFVDRNSFEVKYGNRSASIGEVYGPWGICEDLLGVELEEQEGFVAVEVEKGLWKLYFDREGNGAGLPAGKKRLEVSLEREVVDSEKEEEGKK